MSLTLKGFLDETEVIQEFVDDSVWLRVPIEVYLTAMEEINLDQDVPGS